VTVVRDRKIRTALRTNQIVGFITVPAWKKINTSYETLLCGIPWNIPRVTYIFSVYTYKFVYQENTSYKWDIPGYTTRKCCIFISYHAMENTVANTSNETFLQTNLRVAKGLIYFQWLSTGFQPILTFCKHCHVKYF